MASNLAKSAKSGAMRRQPRQARSQERVNQILDVAEQMLITEGFAATTTNAIAARAKVPIGSLYQFFPDKAAILQALTMRYIAILRQQLAALHQGDGLHLSLVAYVEQVIQTTEQCFADYPGYHAIYKQVQGTVAELEALETLENRLLIQEFAGFLAQYGPGLESDDYELIGFVLVESIGTLLWIALSQKQTFRERLVLETKRLMLSYLQSYFPNR
jgi:AcrR family transcriptional regulator